jgi:hypothetical protein
MSVCTWSAQNGLILSPQKCHAMFISPIRRASLPPVSNLLLGNTDYRVQKVNELRLLGVTFTADLKWSTHASRTIGAVCQE